jgi:hypothetical protein
MKYSLMAEECPQCKKLTLIAYHDGMNGFKKCKECEYQEELPPEECNKGCCNCC